MQNNFWIGDKVVLKKSGRKGTINGFTSDGKVIVSTDNKKVVSAQNNIEKLEEEIFIYPDWVFEYDETSRSEKLQISDTIDLHIEVLAPARKNDPPAVIFDLQVRKALDFIHLAYSQKYPFVKLICGKGQGVLRNHLIEILRGEEAVKLISEQHDGGALNVWINII